jgi:hypothetical protein
MDYKRLELRKQRYEDVGNKFFPWMLSARKLILSASILESQCASRKYLPHDLDKYEDELEANSPRKIGDAPHICRFGFGERG